jgi:Methane oxygenase PmoA
MPAQYNVLSQRQPEFPMHLTRPALAFILFATLLSSVDGQPKAPPRTQALPLPHDQVEFQHDRGPLTRYHYAAMLQRPFLYPIPGPSGVSLTRMGHPHDPTGHSHHNSVWISHQNVNGVNFWEDKGRGHIVQQALETLTDADAEASLTARNAWIDQGSRKTLMLERRKVAVQPLGRGEWLLVIDLQFETNAQGDEVIFGKSPFGPIGVRMAKSIDVNDGGGTIRNSDGKANAKEIHWKPAKWVDYSGASTQVAGRIVVEGITLMDHPRNPNHPTVFHVRNDGWMGASLTFDAPRKIEPGQPLRLCYGVYVHAGMPSIEALEQRWSAFAKTAVSDLAPSRKK